MMETSTRNALSARLFLFLSRWSLVTALLLLAATVFYASEGAPTGTGTVFGQEYGELLRAADSLISYRLATLFETLHWLMLGGTLIILAAVFALRAPIRAACVALCGICQLEGSLGALLRLDGIGDLAARYASAASDQRTVFLQSFLDLKRVSGADYDIALLLGGVGFLLVAWLAWRWTGFPRWLAVGLGATGLLGLAVFVMHAAGLPAAPMIALDVIVLIAVLVAVAVAFWRPSAVLVSGFTEAPAPT
jgi:hypothetical protein